MAKIITLAKGLTLIGELHAESNVRLEGHFEGNGLIKGTLYILPGAFWEGSLIAELAVIQGVLQGDISAQRVLMLAGSQVTGTIFAPLVQMQFGAVFNGVLRMRSERKALVGSVTQLPAKVRQIARA